MWILILRLPGALSTPAATTTSSMTNSTPTAATSGATTANNTTATTTASNPDLPSRPDALNAVVNRTASNYSPYGATSRFGASPYGTGYGGYSSPYSSPYSRLGGMGSMYGGYGGYGSMYGGMGGMGMGGMGGMGGMYGGMPGDPNDPNSLTNSFGQSTQATFQLIESIVGAFGGFAQMLESTYMATHSSFFGRFLCLLSPPWCRVKRFPGAGFWLTRMQRWCRWQNNWATCGIPWDLRWGSSR